MFYFSVWTACVTQLVVSFLFNFSFIPTSSHQGHVIFVQKKQISTPLLYSLEYFELEFFFEFFTSSDEVVGKRSITARKKLPNTNSLLPCRHIAVTDSCRQYFSYTFEIGGNQNLAETKICRPIDLFFSSKTHR